MARAKETLPVASFSMPGNSLKYEGKKKFFFLFTLHVTLKFVFISSIYT